MYGIHHLVGAFSFAFWFFCFFGCLLIIPPRAEADKVTGFVVRSKNSRLGSFYGFAADRTVHKEMIESSLYKKAIHKLSSPMLQGFRGFLFLSMLCLVQVWCKSTYCRYALKKGIYKQLLL